MGWMAFILIDWISISSSYLTKARLPDSIRGRRYQMIKGCMLVASVQLSAAVINYLVLKLIFLVWSHSSG